MPKTPDTRSLDFERDAVGTLETYLKRSRRKLGYYYMGDDLQLIDYIYRLRSFTSASWRFNVCIRPSLSTNFEEAREFFQAMLDRELLSRREVLARTVAKSGSAKLARMIEDPELDSGEYALIDDVILLNLSKHRNLSPHLAQGEQLDETITRIVQDSSVILLDNEKQWFNGLIAND